MTVHRVGKPEEDEQHTVSLGRVLVTIDDLDALTDVLRRKIYHPDVVDKKPRRHRVEFDGGYFDGEASDLSKLSPDERKTLKIQGRNIQVILSPTRAVAIGNKKEAEDIYEIWARRRQTKLPPPDRHFTDHPVFVIPLVSAAITFIVVYPAFLTSPPWHPLTYALFPLTVFLVVTTLSWIIFSLADLAYSRYSRYFPAALTPKTLTPLTYAIIVPYSHEEYDKKQAADRYPRRQWVVAIWAAAISFLAIAVAILIAVFDNS